jgi:hypothetical protein
VPRIITLTAAVTLTTVLAVPSAAPASPRGPAAVPPSPSVLPPPPDESDRLTAALLTATELPAGFKPQAKAADDLFARIPAEIAACGQAVTGVPAGTVYREYVRGAGDEELLVETLAEPGADAARAAVAKLAATLPACTSFTRAAGQLPMELTFALTPYAQAPKIGDTSAAVSFVMTVPTMNLTVNGRLLAAAAGKSHVTTLLMTEVEPKLADLEAAARAAVGKLPKVSR